jgi:serine/threonine protein phosphatase PrpC
MGYPTDERGRRAPTPSALASLLPVPDGFRVLPDPLHGQPLLRIPARPADVRVLLDRSHESAQAGEPTQDYLAVRCDPRRLSFAVTDGVGSSFLGDVAAQILAIQLADWLAAGPGGDQVASALDRYLHQLANEVAERVATWPIAESVPALIRAALDQQRTYGSEAMFVAGTVDLTGRRDATVTVAWLGDARLRVIMRDGQMLDHSGQTTDRWSSRLGPRGAVQTRTWPVADVARVVACTDGLLSELDATVELPDAPLQELLYGLARRPGNDDMALVDIGLAPRAMPPGDAAANPTLWRRLTEDPPGRHARSTPAGSALRRIIRAVGPVASSGAPAAPLPGTVPTNDATPVATGSDPSAAAYAEPPARDSSSTMDSAASPGIEPPGPIGWRRIDRGRELNWPPVAGADSYAVELCREKTFGEPMLYSVPGLTFSVPPMGAPLFGRVRSVAGGEPGPWGPVYDLSERPTEPGAS